MSFYRRDVGSQMTTPDDRPTTSGGCGDGNHNSISTSTDEEDKSMNSNLGDHFTILSSDRSKLKDLLCNRLSECGWREEVRGMCKNILRERGTSINADELMAEVIPKARAVVPDTIKKELLVKIRSILSAQTDGTQSTAPSSEPVSVAAAEGD